MFVSCVHEKVRKGFISLLICIILGCGGSMKAVKTDTKTGYFPTSTELAPGDYYVKEKLAINKYKNLIYIRPLKYIDAANRKNTIPSQFDDFLKKSVINIMYFNSVKDKNDMISYLKDKAVSDPSDYKELNKVIGNFLIMQTEINRIDAFFYTMSLFVYDSATGDPVLKIFKSAKNVNGLDEPLFYPVLNGFIGWVNQNKNR